jgi:hypothetical protein
MREPTTQHKAARQQSSHQSQVQKLRKSHRGLQNRNKILTRLPESLLPHGQGTYRSQTLPGMFRFIERAKRWRLVGSQKRGRAALGKRKGSSREGIAEEKSICITGSGLLQRKEVDSRQTKLTITRRSKHLVL